MTQLTPAVSKNDHTQGNPDAPVTLVEYGDFGCSDCGQAYKVVQQVQKEMGGQMLFVFRNFPLTDIHPNALGAAVFAEEAGLQNDFWQAHDRLYTDQDALDPASLAALVARTQLDPDKIKRDQNIAVARVEADVSSGQQSGVQATPTFFINGEKFDGSWDFQALLGAVRQAARGLVEAR